MVLQNIPKYIRYDHEKRYGNSKYICITGSNQRNIMKLMKFDEVSIFFSL